MNLRSAAKAQERPFAHGLLALLAVACGCSQHEGPIGPAGPAGDPGLSCNRVVIVSPQADPISSGTALRTALDGIVATAAKPVTLKLDPGTYDIGATPLAMKEFVDIEGSGESRTTIGGRPTAEDAGIVVGANNAEIRNLKVAVTDVSVGTKGIYANSTSPGIKRVTVNSFGTAVTLINSRSMLSEVTVYVTGSVTLISSAPGIAISGGGPILSHVYVSIGRPQAVSGVSISNSYPVMTDLQVSAGSLAGSGGYGISITQSDISIRDSRVAVNNQFGRDMSALYSYNSSLELSNVTLDASLGTAEQYAITNDGSEPGTLVIRNSIVKGRTYSIRNLSAQRVVKVGASELAGPVTGPGAFTCAASYNGEFLALGTNCL